MKTPKLSVTWFGHSAFLLESPLGVCVLIDPWLDNPKAPPGAKEVGKIELILITHGHGDHIGNTVELASKTGAKVVAIHEVSLYLTGKGLTNVQGMNKGGSLKSDGVTVTMVDARHSSDIDNESPPLPGGEAAGYVVEFANGYRVYHAGDTALFGDMKLIGEVHKPDLALLPVGDLFTMGPREAARACEMIKPKKVIGMHYGTFPLLTGTPEQMRKHLPQAMRSRVVFLEPGVSTALT